MTDEAQGINWNQIAAIVILSLITGLTAGGGVNLFAGRTGQDQVAPSYHHSHKEVMRLESQMDILWEEQKRRVARQIGELR